MPAKAARVLFHALNDIAVVPAVIDDLDQDGVIDRMPVHLFDQHLDRSRNRGWFEVGFVRVGEGKAPGIVGPDVHMSVDHERTRGGKRDCGQTGKKRSTRQLRPERSACP
jgi:hypothetical protein